MNRLVTSPKYSGFDVAIVGAGVLGCAIAVSLARAGMSVTVIDANTMPGFGSTSSSAGIIRVHAFDRESAAMAHESVAAWSHWRDFTEAAESEEIAEFIQCGSYIIEDDAVIDVMAATMVSAGVPHSELDGDALAAALPWVDTRRFGPPARVDSEEFWREPSERVERALHTPASGYVGEPSLAARNLAALATRLDVTFLLGRRVVRIGDCDGGRTALHLDDGSISFADVVVNAAGPHSGVVNALAGVGADFRVRTELQRHELHHFRMPDGLDMARDGAHIVDGDLGINFRPDGGGAVLVGDNGAPIDGSERIDDPDAFHPAPTRAQRMRNAARLARRVPGLRISATPSGLAGLYDVTEDWLPIYDKTDRPGFFVAMGTSGNQFKTAPVVGDLMLDLIEADLAGVDSDQVTLEHRLPATGRRIPLSTFSRLRTPQKGASRG